MACLGQLTGLECAFVRGSDRLRSNTKGISVKAPAYFAMRLLV